MAVDISEELFEKIMNEFNSRYKRNREVSRFIKLVEEERASLEDASLFARGLGDIASETLIAEMTEENLPNGVLYYNIAERTILPLLKHVHGMVNEYAMRIQNYLDEKDGIGIKPVEGDFQEERVHALIQKIVDYSTGELNE